VARGNTGTTWHRRDDPGLQPERTELAWQRTMISFVAAALLLTRWAGHFGGLVVAMVALACVGAGYILLEAHRRTRLIAPSVPHRPVPVAVRQVISVTLLALTLGALGLAITIGQLRP
jgi:uncharacterized membrane protein YidH (DUF202 family)